MARASAQVSHRNHSKLARFAEEARLGTAAGAGDALGEDAPRSRLPKSSMTAVATGGTGTAGEETGRASGGRSIPGTSAGMATRAGAGRCSWSNATTSSNRRTRSSNDSDGIGGASREASASFGSKEVSASVGDAEGGPPSSAKRARAVSSSPLMEGADVGSGRAASVAGCGSFRESLGGTAFFLRAARSVLLLDIVTLALTPYSLGHPSAHCPAYLSSEFSTSPLPVRWLGGWVANDPTT